MYALFEFRRRLRQEGEMLLGEIAGTFEMCKRQARRSMMHEWYQELAAVPPATGSSELSVRA
jgi:hypothetical protein